MQYIRFYTATRLTLWPQHKEATNFPNPTFPLITLSGENFNPVVKATKSHTILWSNRIPRIIVAFVQYFCKIDLICRVPEYSQ